MTESKPLGVAVFDTKPYDREYLTVAAEGTAIEWHFLDFRLVKRSMAAAAGLPAVCLFVNDQADAAALRHLAEKGCQHIALRCAGFNNIDLKVAHELGLKVTRVPAYSPHAVAEHSVALLLTLNRKIHRAFNRVREHNFSLAGLVGFDLHGKTVGIIGTGKIGRITAQIFRGFGCKVVAYDVREDAAWAAEHQVRHLPLDQLLQESDIISLHAPLMPETHHLINARTLGLMKKGAYLVNTSRGKLIETRALIEALKQGHLGGVALDVYEEEEGVFFEDLSDSVLVDDELTRLISFPNVLVTSHQAFLTREALVEIARVTVQNIVNVSAGLPFLPGTKL